MSPMQRHRDSLSRALIAHDFMRDVATIFFATYYA